VSNATRWYTSREAAKAAAGLSGSGIDAVIDTQIEAASETAEQVLNRTFIPVTETRYYDWPQKAGRSAILYEPREDILALTALTAGGTAIALGSIFLEPVNEPPYRQVEIDLSTSAAFQSGDTTQQSVAATGRFGYSEATKTAGAVASGLASDAAAATFVCSNAALIDVGDTLLIETEALFVSGRAFVSSGTTVNDATVTESLSDVTITLASGAAVNVGEVLLLDSEKVRVEAISGNDVTVERGVDGSVLAAHSTGITVYVARTLTVVRGANGTTAAVHADSTAIVKYAPAALLAKWVRAMAILAVKEGASGYTGQISGDSAVNINANEVERLRMQCIEAFGVVSL